jgi:hypothetical protein
MATVLTESKPQCWRAIAIYEDGREALIYLGLSSQKIREGYVEAYFEVLDAEERAMVKTISLQRWNGAPDAGKWSQTTTLTIPAHAKKMAKVAA